MTKGYLPFHPNPQKPDFILPQGSCDAHCHVFGPSALFPYSEQSCYVPVDASKEILFQRHQLLGIDRAVIVQASCHGMDNSAMLDALSAAGDNYRGVAIVGPDVSFRELDDMHRLGVRGVRFNFLKRLNACLSESARRTIVEKISSLSWHIVVYFEPEDLPGIEEFLLSIEAPVVIDHMGRVPVEKGLESAEFKALSALLAHDNFWVKISCCERLSKQGPPYNDANEVVSELIRLVPDRVLWGTDWPHPNMKKHMPDDGQLVNMLPLKCPDQDVLKKILVDNPTRLYWND